MKISGRRPWPAGAIAAAVTDSVAVPRHLYSAVPDIIRQNIGSRWFRTLTISPCDIGYRYQGLDPGAGGDYHSLPWRPALLTQTNFTR